MCENFRMGEGNRQTLKVCRHMVDAAHTAYASGKKIWFTYIDGHFYATRMEKLTPSSD